VSADIDAAEENDESHNGIIYKSDFNDSEGNALDGNKKKYTLTFDAGQLPPVNAFWSVTMYDKNQLLVENPINRYLVNAPMRPGLNKNKDGSLTFNKVSLRRHFALRQYRSTLDAHHCLVPKEFVLGLA